MLLKANLEGKSLYELLTRTIPKYAKNEIKLQIKYLYNYFYPIYYYIKPQKRIKGNKFEEYN